MRRASISALCLLAASVTAAVAANAQPPAMDGPLRVCAATDNFPLSDRAGSGFENTLAQFVAQRLDTTVVTTWWPARENFLARTLNEGDCDVVMGVPANLDEVDTTIPYYRSSYVFVSRTNAHLNVTSMKDVRLGKLRIGVYVIGDNPTPPALALAESGISSNVHGFMTFHDRQGEKARPGLIAALEDGSLDVAAVWGPLVGYDAKRATTPLTVTPIADTESFAPLLFRYDIAMGVRKGDVRLRDKLNHVIAENRNTIRHLLAAFDVPLLPMGAPVVAN